MGDFGWRGLAIVLFGGLFLLVLLVAFNLLYRDHPSGDPVQKMYRRFCRKLERIGVRKSSSEGATHFAQRAIRQHPELAAAINKITRLYNAIRYAQHDEPAGTHARVQLRRAVNEFNPSIRQKPL